MFTKVIEGLVVALVAAICGGYLAVTITQAHTDERVSSLEHRVDAHLSEAVENRKILFNKLDKIQECLMTRCNK